MKPINDTYLIVYLGEFFYLRMSKLDVELMSTVSQRPIIHLDNGFVTLKDEWGVEKRSPITHKYGEVKGSSTVLRILNQPYVYSLENTIRHMKYRVLPETHSMFLGVVIVFSDKPPIFDAPGTDKKRYIPPIEIAERETEMIAKYFPNCNVSYVVKSSPEYFEGVAEKIKTFPISGTATRIDEITTQNTKQIIRNMIDAYPTPTPSELVALNNIREALE